MPLALRYPGIFASAAGASGTPYGLIDFSTGGGIAYYTIAEGSPALLNLPSGAWAWGFWTRINANSGTNSQTLLGSGAFNATPSFNLFITEASAGDPNKWAITAKDDAGVTVNVKASATTGADSVLRLVVVQSTGTTVEMWHCAVASTASRVINSATNLGVLTAPAVWNIGRISDGQADQYYESELGGGFKANVALSQSEIELIAGGASPVSVLGANCIEYWPFKNKTLGDNETGAVAGLVASYHEVATFNPPAFVQKGTGYSQPTAAQSHTFSYTCAVSPGSNRILVLCFGNKAGITTYDAVTYNGVAMTQAIIINNSTSATAAIYYLLAANVPNDGAAHDFVINFSGSGSTQAWAMPIEYINVKQAAPHRTATQTGTADGSLSLTTVAVDSLLVDSFCTNSTNASSTPGANQNERYDVGTGNGSYFTSDKLPAGHSGGTVAMTQDQTQGGNKAYVAAAWEKATS